MSKKINLSPFSFLILFFFRMPIYALYSANVYGYKYFSSNVDGQIGFNAFEVLIFKQPYFNITGNKKLNWNYCNEFDEHIKKDLIRYNQYVKEALPYRFIVEKTENSYKAFIDNGIAIIYISGFPDWGGGAPSLAEINVCTTNGLRLD